MMEETAEVVTSDSYSSVPSQLTEDPPAMLDNRSKMPDSPSGQWEPRSSLNSQPSPSKASRASQKRLAYLQGMGVMSTPKSSDVDSLSDSAKGMTWGGKDTDAPSSISTVAQSEPDAAKPQTQNVAEFSNSAPSRTSDSVLLDQSDQPTGELPDSFRLLKWRSLRRVPTFCMC